MAVTQDRRQRIAAMAWGVVAVAAAAVYWVTFGVVLDRLDAGLSAGPWAPFTWPAAGLAVVAFATSMVHLVRSGRAQGPAAPEPRPLDQ